ncbi:helix-turn-helix domain-containing protein [Ruania zhangjianzhongii]|uniref:helix-turn-helix domain-containing protein n=1 Tax=Ruania zhangjianzhongii TaxID=2603206 RepID=UPI001AEFD360|nr:helix-turn-helix domain-containing protein [Ruania zhangjianzhongii]
MAERTYLPTEEPGLAEVYSFLDAHEGIHGTRVRPRCLLVGENDQVELPAPMYQLLLQVVESLRAGRAVTVAPHATTLTTQQAADLLGVSRPTVVRLIDAGELPAERPGNRRKVLLRDVLDYRERRRAQQYEMLAATAIDIDDEDDPVAVAAQLREVRNVVADRRRA